MNFKFELSSDANEIGVVELGATDGINGTFRIYLDLVDPIKKEQDYRLRFHIERMPFTNSSKTTWWNEEYIYVGPNFTKGFDVTLTTKRFGGPWVDFYWLNFNFKMTPDGLMLTKTGEPNTENACNLSNETLGVMILQEGIVLNNFNLTVIQNILKRKKEK